MKKVRFIQSLQLIWIVSGVSSPFLCFAGNELNIDELRSLIQLQQKQIEQQSQQLQLQNQAIKTLQEKFLERQNGSEIQNYSEKKVDSLNTDDVIERFSFEGYATANYFNHDWETFPDKRDEADLERISLEGKFRFDEHWSVHAEIEFEHGGTGSTMEFDALEEFGEFEQEVEKGGEIVVEELLVQYQPRSWFGLRVGEIPVPVGLINKRHKPSDYYTTTRSEAESEILPVAWHELGVEVRGLFKGLYYRGQVISGLDSTGFSSANWIKRGFQKRFERKNTDNLAFVASLDYELAALDIDALNGMQIGGSFYWGNTSDNRPKPDLDDDAVVTIYNLHSSFESDWGAFRASAIWGDLSNADLVSAANRRLSNNLNVKRTPVAASAFAWYAEAGVNLFYFIQNKPAWLGYRFDWFGRYDYYDSMHKTSGLVFDNPRWEREVWTTGFNFAPIKGVTFKGQYAYRTLNISSANVEETYSLGIATEF